MKISTITFFSHWKRKQYEQCSCAGICYDWLLNSDTGAIQTARNQAWYSLTSQKESVRTEDSNH